MERNERKAMEWMRPYGLWMGWSGMGNGERIHRAQQE